MYTKEEQQVAQDKVDDDGPRAGAQEHNGYRNGEVDEAKDIAVARQAHAPLKQRGRGKDDDGAEHRGQRVVDELRNGIGHGDGDMLHKEVKRLRHDQRHEPGCEGCCGGNIHRFLLR